MVKVNLAHWFIFVWSLRDLSNEQYTQEDVRHNSRLLVLCPLNSWDRSHVPNFVTKKWVLHRLLPGMGILGSWSMDSTVTGDVTKYRTQRKTLIYSKNIFVICRYELIYQPNFGFLLHENTKQIFRNLLKLVDGNRKHKNAFNITSTITRITELTS